MATWLRNPSGRVGATGRSFLRDVVFRNASNLTKTEDSMRNPRIPALMLFLVTMCGVLARPAAAELRYSTFSEPLDALTLLMAPPSEDAPTSTSAEVAPAYGDQGDRRWSIGGMVATDFQNERIASVRGGLEWFPIDAFSLGLDADLGWVGQDAGDDAVFVGVSVMLRWHFLRNESWTLYADLASGWSMPRHRSPRTAVASTSRRRRASDVRSPSMRGPDSCWGSVGITSRTPGPRTPTSGSTGSR